MKNKFMKHLALSSLILSASVSANAADYRVVPQDGARIQWENDGGYCGALSVQVAGIEMGFWVSQHQGRTMAGGEVLLGVNMDQLLETLNLNYVNYSGPQKGGQADRENFLQWIQDSMEADDPMIIAVKSNHWWGGNSIYDHIIPIHAVNGQASGYNGSDTMPYSDNFTGQEETYTFDEWRDGWMSDEQLYYLAEKKQYGTRILGMIGEEETHPIYLRMQGNSEPNVTIGEAATTLNATVHMDDLQSGTTYTLLRWDADYSNVNSIVPTSNILASATQDDVELEFNANGSSKTHNVSFASDGITIFKLVAGTVGNGGGGGALLDDGFEDGNLDGWTKSANNLIGMETGNVNTGSYAVYLKRSASISTTVDVSSKDSVELSFAVDTYRMDNGEAIIAETSTDGGSWTVQYSGKPTSYQSETVSVDVAGENTLHVRFRTTANRNNEFGFVDDVKVQ